MANYLTYFSKVMNITQNYSNDFSHQPHSSGNPKDYPIDEACADSGRSYFYCPCDEMKIVSIYGVGNGGTNTIWMESTTKVIFADGTSDYVTILVTHPNDDTLKNIYVGQKFKRNQAMFLEGNDGRATGWHFHVAVGKGHIRGGWVKNSNGSWVIDTYGGPMKPENAFAIDTSFTTKIINKKGIVFKTLADVKKSPVKATTNSFLPNRGYFTKGDNNVNVGKISAYLGEKAQGNLFGDYLISLIKVFQSKNKLEVDGRVGKLTLAKLKADGFKEPKNFIPSKGYLGKNDKSTNVSTLATYMSKKAQGNVYGDYLIALVKVFQAKNGLTVDGNIGSQTLNKLKADGFKE